MHSIIGKVLNGEWDKVPPLVKNVSQMRVRIPQGTLDRRPVISCGRKRCWGIT